MNGDTINKLRAEKIVIVKEKREIEKKKESNKGNEGELIKLRAQKVELDKKEAAAKCSSSIKPQIHILSTIMSL